MRNGRFSKKRTMPKGKRLISMLLCMVLLGASIGATIAYLNDKSNTVTNTFIPAEVKIQIDETLKGNVKSDVKILNVKTDKTIPAYIRAEIIVTWQNSDGEVLGKTPKLGTDYSMEINTANWTEDGGYYYHKGAVDPGEHTAVLIEKAETKVASIPNPANPDKPYYLCIEILASAVQSMPDTAVAEYWGTTAAGLVK